MSTLKLCGFLQSSKTWYRAGGYPLLRLLFHAVSLCTLLGAQILFSIGNPSTATFSDPKITLTWNRGIDNFDTYEEYKKAVKKKEFSVLKDLKSGSWSSVELFVTPCDKSELEDIEFSIELNTVKLNVG